MTYIILDSVFIIIFLALLFFKKRYATFYFALIGGIIYWLVDYGLFYLASGSRQIFVSGIEQDSLHTALILFWMSMSYGITNFAFIWLCLSKDKHLKEWLFLIIMWWIACPILSSIGGGFNIETTRTTTKYHYIMVIFLLVGYGGLIIHNLFTKKSNINILWLCLIGIAVQFSWEAALLIGGIRPINSASLVTLFVDSLVETNMGMPYIYLIYLGFTYHYTEDLKKIKIK